MSVPANRFKPRPSYTTITGLSSTMRMPRLGKIRLGIKVKNAAGKEYPKDVDYFVCPPEVQEIYGAQPKELDVLIPTTDPALYFPQALKWYKGARLVCKGNGETATRINEETGDMFEMACPCEQLHDPQTNPKGPCRPRANLMLILPRVSMGGAYQVDTGSTNNIVNINSTLKWVESMLGRVAWVPLTLKRVPTKIQTPDGTTTKSLLQLEFKGNMQDAAALRQSDWISIQGGSVPAALPPHVIDDDGPGDVTAEVVDEVTGEVTDAPVEMTTANEIRAADAAVDVPFPEPETLPSPPRPTYSWEEKPPDAPGRIVQTANAITDRNEFDVFVKIIEPALEKMQPGMRKAVEASLATKQAELFA